MKSNVHANYCHVKFKVNQIEFKIYSYFVQKVIVDTNILKYFCLDIYIYALQIFKSTFSDEPNAIISTGF